MALNIIPIIKFLAQSKGIAETANLLIKQFKNKTDSVSSNDVHDIKKMLEVQASLNDQLQKQINLMQLSLINLKSIINFLRLFIILSLVISIAALLVAVLL